VEQAERQEVDVSMGDKEVFSTTWAGEEREMLTELADSGGHEQFLARGKEEAATRCGTSQ